MRGGACFVEGPSSRGYSTETRRGCTARHGGGTSTERGRREVRVKVAAT
jgi:hypothetical protein